MVSADAARCFQRHATSKISVAEDLYSIVSKGFRGEALASIASIAHVELKTRHISEEHGVLLQLEGGKAANPMPCAFEEGTQISVRHLFFNVPARRNFLKSDAVELRHVIDEIHRLSRVAEELLYPAMEDRRLDLTVGKGSTARTRALDLPPFTLVGATTRAGALSSPLRDRFGLIQRLEFYGLEDLQAIVERAAGLLNLELSEAACTEIARRCRGTPRIANRLLRRVRDVACVRACEGCIDQHLVDEALTLHRVDGRGLDASDRRLMELLLQSHGGGPAGLDTLAAALGEDPSTLESVVEPYLLQLGFLQRTPRGRVVTAAGRGHLGWPEGQEQVA